MRAEPGSSGDPPARAHDFAHYARWLRPRVDTSCRETLLACYAELPQPALRALTRCLDTGKRIRGSLVCLTSQALGGTLVRALPRAVAIEFTQAASLIHDDYVDQDVVRRGHPAEWVLEGPRQAVLLGDLLFATAIRSLMMLGREDGLAITHAIASVSRGAYQELLDDAVQRPRDSRGHEADVYETIIRLKTGSLVGVACQLGALAAKAPDHHASSAYEFGVHVGEAYQLANDWKEVIHLRDANAQPAVWRSRLSPLLSHVDASFRDVRPEDLKIWLADMIPRVEQCLGRDVRTRVDRAGSQLDDFPENRFTQCLRTVARQVVEMQTAAFKASSASRAPSSR